MKVSGVEMEERERDFEWIGSDATAKINVPERFVSTFSSVLSLLPTQRVTCCSS